MAIIPQFVSVFVILECELNLMKDCVFLGRTFCSICQLQAAARIYETNYTVISIQRRNLKMTFIDKTFKYFNNHETQELRRVTQTYFIK